MTEHYAVSSRDFHTELGKEGVPIWEYLDWAYRLDLQSGKFALPRRSQQEFLERHYSLDAHDIVEAFFSVSRSVPASHFPKTLDHYLSCRAKARHVERVSAMPERVGRMAAALLAHDPFATQDLHDRALLEAEALRVAIDALPVGKDIRTRLQAHLDRHLETLRGLGIPLAQLEKAKAALA